MGIHTCRFGGGSIEANGMRRQGIGISGLRECQAMGVLMDHSPVPPSSWDLSAPLRLPQRHWSLRLRQSSSLAGPPSSVLPVTAAHWSPHALSGETGPQRSVWTSTSLTCLLLAWVPTLFGPCASKFQVRVSLWRHRVSVSLSFGEAAPASEA